eukprot:NODE_5346_length_688_cov_17.557121_g4972_i0.p1 GENE.NODE_5346_length_688_cov_17.557121_g4972_i0~~NODE_5346_length_688_cov_17.557121_g4972_i0.p1  ORF type:complete len:144 (-),score=27.97 NODE_5346_length_688_cov_17.557121_g4972_i0:166-597(-)
MAERRVDKDLRRPMRDDGLPDVKLPGAPPPIKLSVVEGEDPSIATFIWNDENHTLGNALRHVLSANPQTSFCGYTIPHPLERKMKMHLRTAPEASESLAEKPAAREVLKGSLRELQSVMTHTLQLFNEAVQDYESSTSAMAEP